MTHSNTVTGTFTYKYPHSDKTFTVKRSWCCRDEADARLIIQRHGTKTGSVGADCVMEVNHAKAK
jgi:hypothetical protein